MTGKGRIFKLSVSTAALMAAVSDIVPVTNPSHDFTFDGSPVLFESLDVRHDLAGVRIVCQAVDHRNRGKFSEI